MSKILRSFVSLISFKKIEKYKKFINVFQTKFCYSTINTIFIPRLYLMNKIYVLILLVVLGFSANAQQKLNDSNFSSVDFNSKVVKFYPNPAVSVINFEFNKIIQRDYTLQIYNFIGKKIYEINAVSQKTTIPLSEFNRGIYIFQLRDKNGKIIESGKFQVSK